MGGHLEFVQVVFLFLLVLVVVFASVAQRLKVPYPIVLVVAGLAISFVPHVPRIPLNPDLVFLIFLPPLLYAAAWTTNLREFRRHLLSISMLALGLVCFTVAGVALLAGRFISSLDFTSGFVLGAVVCTTDAIAAAAIAKQIGLPQAIVDLLEGESLVNDATGLLALEFALQMLTGSALPTITGGLLRLLWLLGGGIAVGLGIGFVMVRLERFVEDGAMEMVVSLIVPYAAYLAGEEVKASGVIAVVACGLYLSRRSVDFLSAEARLQIWGGWSALNFMLNGLVFVLIGLQLPYVLAGIRGYGAGRLVLYGAAFSLVLIVLRLVWVFPGAWFSWWVRTRLGAQVPTPQVRSTFFIGWTGMRGVLALAAALSLPETLGNGQPFAQRNLIVFLTFAVILVTLVLQGLSLPWLAKALGLTGEQGASPEEVAARRLLLEETVASLTARRLLPGLALAQTHAADDLLHRYRHRLAALADGQAADKSAQGSGSAAIYRAGQQLLREVQSDQRRTVVRLRDEGRIGDDVLRRLERELDLVETRDRIR